jgi:polysaccharide biosynthesis transport protein
MAEPFQLADYLGYLRDRWKFLAITILSAALLTGAASLLIPKRYTATATLVIEPPVGADPRNTVVLNGVYLESLKTYEDFAGSDSLFARANEKFGLLAKDGGSSFESLKNRVLRVNKPKETKVLAISVTLNDPKLAQTVAQFLAEQTVALNRNIAQSGEGESRQEIGKQLDAARVVLEKARGELADAESSGSLAALDEEVRGLADVRSRITEQLVSANALVAEMSVRGDSDDTRREVASGKARVASLEAQRAALERDAAAKTTALAGLRARLGRAEDQVRSAQSAVDVLVGRSNDLAASSGLRTEQLRIVDPGIVPQRPSFPRPVLFTVAAAVIALVLSVAYLSVLFGLSTERTRAGRPELKVARGGGR